jgi:hypothetical protein
MEELDWKKDISLHNLNKMEAKCLGERLASQGANVLLIEEPETPAISANLPIYEAISAMVVDIGDGITELSSHLFKWCGLLFFRNRDRAVGIATGLRAGRSSSPGRVKYFLFQRQNRL